MAYTNGASATLSINTYDEYGQPGAGNAGRFQYTGQMWLPEAQLYHYRARAYAPQLGRFMQTDPIGYGDGPNLYAYVGGDPINLDDPWGLKADKVPDVVVDAHRSCPGGLVEVGQEADGSRICRVMEEVRRGPERGETRPSSGGGSDEVRRICERDRAASEATRGNYNYSRTDRWNRRWDLEWDLRVQRQRLADAQRVGNFFTFAGLGTAGGSLAAKHGLGGAAARTAAGPVLGAALTVGGAVFEWSESKRADIIVALENRLREMDSCRGVR